MSSEKPGNRLAAIGDADQCIARLQASRSAILELLQSYDDVAVTTRPDAETWSALMVLEHLTMVEAATARIIRRLRLASAGATMPPVQMQAGRWRSDGRPIAPDAVTPRGEGTRAEVESAFAAARETLLAVVEDCRDSLDTSATIPHAFLGELNGLGWLRMMAWHEPKHLEQLQRILSTVTTNGNGKHTDGDSDRGENAPASLQWDSADG